MASVAKWLRQWFVVPPFAGSSPVVRPDILRNPTSDPAVGFIVIYTDSLSRTKAHRMNKVDDILHFWFGTPDRDENYGKMRSLWFESDPIVDRVIQDKFEEVYHFAADGLLDGWQYFPASCLALIIVLDQFPRNIFRGTPNAFATDDLALKVAEYAIDAGMDRQLLPVQKWFIYLPFEHSENLDRQLKSVELFNTLSDNPDSHIAIDSARTHLEIIRTFGRFPHRNQILGRESTPAELEFLARPDAFKG
jgi:uncharacterized protein (DUF924 family)